MANADAQRLGSCPSVSAHVHTKTGRRALRLRPDRVTRHEDAGHCSGSGMDQRRLGLEQRREEATPCLNLEGSIVPDCLDLEPDLVQMRDEYDQRIAFTHA